MKIIKDNFNAPEPRKLSGKRRCLHCWSKFQYEEKDVNYWHLSYNSDLLNSKGGGCYYVICPCCYHKVKIF